jgi:hypothetical protein
LKKQVRGIRPLERAVEKRTDDEATVIRQYCLAVRGALDFRWTSPTFGAWTQTERSADPHCCLP